MPGDRRHDGTGPEDRREQMLDVWRSEPYIRLLRYLRAIPMSGAAPLELTDLFHGTDGLRREAAWEQLIAAHTRLLLAVARSYGGDQDDAMERYAYILEKLREAGFRRLRSFNPTVGASFSTWLTVGAQRLCVDYHRARYGRYDAVSADSAGERRAVRRTLLESVGPDVDVDLLPDSTALAADTQAILAERNALLRSELVKLTARERLVLALRFEDGRSAAEIARLVGARTPFVIYRQLNHLLARLRAALEARGVRGVEG